MPKSKAPSPPEVVRAALAEARRDGLPFSAAWEYHAWPALMARINGLRNAPRLEWQTAMLDTRGEWQAAYEGRETHWSMALAGRETFANAVADYLTDPWAVAAA